MERLNPLDEMSTETLLAIGDGQDSLSEEVVEICGILDRRIRYARGELRVLAERKGSPTEDMLIDFLDMLEARDRLSGSIASQTS